MQLYQQTIVHTKVPEMQLAIYLNTYDQCVVNSEIHQEVCRSCDCQRQN